MNMSVDHDGRVPLIQQRAEAFKTAVAQILLISDTADGGMRQQDVETSG